jgi:hypothetical protein
MDPEFFEMVAMPLFDQLYNFAHWLTGDRADAEDLVQETYAKALKGFKSFEEGTNLGVDVQDSAQHIPDFAQRIDGPKHELAR